MDTFMCSSWYFLRYASPQYDRSAFDPEKVKYWLPVDQYTGGAEHAVMHLFYARFFVKAIRDLGLVGFDEPFTRLFNQGTIIADRHKMSKSRGNVVNPDNYVSELGADTVRAYLMFIGPWDQGGEWDDSGINGIARWLNRVWNLVLQSQENPLPKDGADQSAVRDLRHITHKTIKRVTDDLEKFRYNTMLALLMELTNYLSKVQADRSADAASWQEAVDALLLMLAPVTPHFAEELWTRTGHAYSIHKQPFPAWDKSLAAEEQVTLVIQINGKVRDKVEVPASITEPEARELALSQPRVKSFLGDKHTDKVIYVPNRLVNIVVKL